MSALNNPIVSNPNDFKVVEFHNSTDFTFTPEMGCMYDGRPIFGITGAPGVNAGESLTVPYHIGHRLATNLAKIVQLKRAPAIDAAGIPTGVPLWSVENLEVLKNSYLKELYVEEKPIPVSETDRLMAKVEEYKAMVDKLVEKKEVEAPVAPVPEVDAPSQANAVIPPPVVTPPAPVEFKDKKAVIAELEKRGIAHNVRDTKADLEKLLTPAVS